GLPPRPPADEDGAGHDPAADRAVGELPAVLARERHALGYGVVDDPRRELGEAVHVRLARAEAPPPERVVEEPLDAVAVVPVALRRVDAPLGGDAVGASRRVVEREAADDV